MKAEQHGIHTNPAGSPAGSGFMTEKEVMATTTFGRSKLREMVAAGEFPAPVVIGVVRGNGTPSRIAWVRSEVIEFIQKVMREARVTWAPAGGVRNLDTRPVQTGRTV